MTNKAPKKRKALTILIFSCLCLILLAVLLLQYARSPEHLRKQYRGDLVKCLPVYDEIMALPDFEELRYDYGENKWLMQNDAHTWEVKEADLSPALWHLLSLENKDVHRIRRSGDDVFFCLDLSFSGYETGIVLSGDASVELTAVRVSQLINMNVMNQDTVQCAFLYSTHPFDPLY